MTFEIIRKGYEFGSKPPCKDAMFCSLPGQGMRTTWLLNLFEEELSTFLTEHGTVLLTKAEDDKHFATLFLMDEDALREKEASPV